MIVRLEGTPLQQARIDRNALLVIEEDNREILAAIAEGLGHEDRTALQDADKGQSLVLPCLLDGFIEVGRQPCGGLGNEGDIGHSHHHTERIHGTEVGSLGRGVGLPAVRSGWRNLHLGQRVDLVVKDQHDGVEVVADGVQPVVAADAEAIPVAHRHDNLQIRPGETDARRDRQGAAMDSVEPVADPGDRDDVFRVGVVLSQDPLETGEDPVVATALAPARHLGLVVLEGMRLHGAGFFQALFGNRRHLSGLPWLKL